MRKFSIALAGAATLAGCGGGGSADGGSGGSGGTATAPAEVAARAAPDATIATPEGKAELRYGDPAAELPASLPVYPGSTPGGSVEITAGAAADRGRITTLRTGDTPAQVIDFYAAAAERAGYRVAQRATIGPNGMLAASNAAGEGVQIHAIGGGEGGTVVQIIAGTPRAR